MARKDIFIGVAGTGERYVSQSNYIVRVANGDVYKFWQNVSANDFNFSKSTDGGYTWDKLTELYIDVVGISVWYDRWTPGDTTGNLIHVAWYGSATDDVFYSSMDTSSDTFSSPLVVFAGVSATTQTGKISITKSEGGKICIAYNLDGGTEEGFEVSSDGGSTFDAKANPGEGVQDFFSLFPGNETDTDDLWLTYWDTSANELSLKTYDDSADSWSEQSIATGMSGTPILQGGVGAAIRQSDDHLIIAAWSAVDTANADLRIWDTNGAGSITELTNVVLNSVDDQGLVALSIDDDDLITVFYAGKSDGSERFAHKIGANIYYKQSSDDGTSWGSETLLTDRIRYPVNLNACINTPSGVIIADFMTSEEGAFAIRVNVLAPAEGGGGLLAHPGMSGGMRG